MFQARPAKLSVNPQVEVVRWAPRGGSCSSPNGRHHSVSRSKRSDTLCMSPIAASLQSAVDCGLAEVLATGRVGCGAVKS
jgi:hypothetical protein